MIIHNLTGPFFVREGDRIETEADGFVMSPRGDAFDAPRTAADIVRVLNAAPALLAALESISEAMGGIVPGWLSAEMAAADKAINQARGRA